MDKARNTQSEKAWWQPAMALFLRMSTWIVIPVIISAFIGKWIDSKFGTDPWVLLVCVGVSFLVSMIGITNIASRELKKIESSEEVEKKIMHHTVGFRLEKYLQGLVNSICPFSLNEALILLELLL